MKKLVLFLFAGIIALGANAQTFTEGKVVSKLTVNTGTETTFDVVTYIKGSKTLSETKTTGENSFTASTEFVDNNAKVLHTYILVSDIVYNEEDIKIAYAETRKMKVTKTKTTKVIAGYTCFKAIAKSKGQKIEIWYAPELYQPKNNWMARFTGIEGMLMEYTIISSDTKYTVTVVSVTKETVDDSKVSPPEGNYTTTPASEFRR